MLSKDEKSLQKEAQAAADLNQDIKQGPIPDKLFLPICKELKESNELAKKTLKAINARYKR